MSQEQERETSNERSGRSFYRIALTNPPTRYDFVSHAERGKRPRNDDPEMLRLWAGVSVYGTPERAEETARLYRALGTIIVEIQIPVESPIVWERTTKSPDHYTIWGNPELLLSYVTAIWSPDDRDPSTRGEQ